MAVPINEVRVEGMCDVASFALVWYDVCSEFIAWMEQAIKLQIMTII